MSIRIGASVLVATLTLGMVPAATANAPAPERTFRSFTFGADCTDMPGRLRVEEKRTGAERFTATLSGTGLPTGIDRDWINWEDDDGNSSTATFEHNPSARRFSHSTTVPEPLDGRQVDGHVSDDDSETGCWVLGDANPHTVSVGGNSVFLTVSRLRDHVTVNVGGARCRGSETPRGRAVVRFADRTVRTSLHSDGHCEDGRIGFLRHKFAGREMPRGVRAVVHSGGRDWHVAYDLRRGRSARLLP